MSDTFCTQCGQVLPAGSLKYIVHIKIMPDFDDLIPYSEKKPFDELQGLFREIEDIDSQGLDDDGYMEISLYLCERCKKRLTEDSLNSKEEGFFSDRNLGKSFH